MPLALVFTLAGCGGGGGDDIDVRVITVADSGPDPVDGGGGTPDSSLFMEECNTTTQSCTDPATPKCTFIVSGGALETECLPETGTLTEGQTCMRTAEGDPGVGHDDCAAGLWCSGVTLPTGPPPQRACRKMCSTNTGCTTAGEQCLSIDGDGPLLGFCLPTCTLFDAATCMTSMSCSININIDNMSAMGLCRMNGTKAAGVACMAHSECMPNMNCISDGMGGGVCANLCDTANACPAGQSCTATPPLANGGGFCQ